MSGPHLAWNRASAVVAIVALMGRLVPNASSIATSLRAPPRGGGGL